MNQIYQNFRDKPEQFTEIKFKDIRKGSEIFIDFENDLFTQVIFALNSYKYNWILYVINNNDKLTKDFCEIFGIKLIEIQNQKEKEALLHSAARRKCLIFTNFINVAEKINKTYVLPSFYRKSIMIWSHGNFLNRNQADFSYLIKDYQKKNTQIIRFVRKYFHGERLKVIMREYQKNL